jgi:phosphodiesterase/alkaline phosphatase D-like protein
MLGSKNWRASDNSSSLRTMGLFLAMILLSPAAFGDQTGITAEAASPNSITLTWTAPGDDSATGTAAQYDLRYSTATITDANWSSATQVAGESTPKAAGTVESFTVTGLESSTTYYFAVKAADDASNWSGLSNIAVKSTTVEATPPAAITTLAAGTATSTSVVLNWTAPGDDSLTGTGSQYDIRYYTSSITDVNWSSATQVTGESAPKVAGSSESFTVTGLQANTTYYFAVKTADEVPNWSGLSNIAAKATLPEQIAPSAIATLTAPSATISTVYLTWTAPGDDSSSGTASQYDIRYATSNITEANWSSATQVTGESAPKVAGSTESFTVTGLQANTAYYFAVKTADEVPNWSALSNIATRTTPNETTAPAAVTNFAATTATSTTVTLTWTAPGDDSITGTGSQYDIRYSTATITAANWSSATQVTGESAPKIAGSSETFTVTGLQNGTTYYFAIKTADEVPNWSGLSNVVTKATPDEIPPAAINDLSALPGAQLGEVILSWSATGDDSTVGRASSYTLKYSTGTINESNWNAAATYASVPAPLAAGTTETMTMTGLEPGQKYYVALKAYDEVSNGSGLSNTVACTAQFQFALNDEDQPGSCLAGPLPGAVLHSSRPTLTVRNVNTDLSNQYYFEVAADSLFFGLVAASPAVDQETGDITSWKIPVRLSPDNIYYWRVRANGDSYSDISYFSVDPSAHPYPNPFRSETQPNVTFTELPQGADLVLMSVSGATVRQWSNLSSDQLTWDGTNESGNKVASGTYLWYLRGSDAKGKLVVIR